MDQDKSFLVLGASGMIGSACVRNLRANGTRKILAPSHQKLDLLDAVAVDNYFSSKKIDVVIMAAGKVGGILENQIKPFEFIQRNLLMQINVCQAAAKDSIKKVVLLGSSCMYPKHTPQPMPVSAILSGMPEPTSLPYAISKLAGIHLGLSFNKQFDRNKFLTIIPNSTFGPGDNFDANSGHVLSALISKFHNAKIEGRPNVSLWGSGKSKREFIFADDVASAIMFLLRNNTTNYCEPYNVGTGKDCAISELANLIRTIVGFEGQILWDRDKPDGTPQKLLDSGPINKMGWNEKFSLTEGIKITYDWYKNFEGRSYCEE